VVNSNIIRKINDFFSKKKVIKHIILLLLFGIITGFLYVSNDIFMLRAKIIVIVIVILIYSSILLCKSFYKIDDKYNWDKPPKIYFYVSMFLPIVGFIMWCVLVNHKPNSAKLTIKGCLCSLLLPILTFIISLPIYFVSAGISSTLRNTIYSDSYTETYNIELIYNQDAHIVEADDLDVKITFKGYKDDLEKFKKSEDFKKYFESNQLSISLKTCQETCDLSSIIEYYVKNSTKKYNLKYKIDNKIIAKIYDKISTVITVYSEEDTHIQYDTLVDLYLYSSDDKVYAKIGNKIKLAQNLSINAKESKDIIIFGTKEQLNNIPHNEYFKIKVVKTGTKNVFFLPENAYEFDFSKFDYIVDAIDTVSGKLALVERAKENDVKIISAMGAGNKLNPTDFEVADIFKTSGCPLARVMRKELKSRGIKSLKVVYSKEKVLKPIVETGDRTPGSVSFVPSVVGIIMASEVVKDITGVKNEQ